jgi:hypothetical protein
MGTTELEAAYRHLIETARAESFRAPADAGQWPAELHIAAAGIESYLSEIGRAAGGHDALVATMRQCGLELVLLARRLDEQQSATPVPTRILDGETTRVDAPLPWAGVLNTHAQVHLARSRPYRRDLRR